MSPRDPWMSPSCHPGNPACPLALQLLAPIPSTVLDIQPKIQPFSFPPSHSCFRSDYYNPLITLSSEANTNHHGPAGITGLLQ